MKVVRVIVMVDGEPVADVSNEVAEGDIDHVVAAVVAQVEEPGTDAE